jgi:EAL and modified HD-GYP domain-containing signal transduction protein
VPLASLLERLPMPAPVVQALVDDSGPYAPFLKLAEASERADFEQIAHYAGEIACSPDELDVAELQALAWTEALAGDAVVPA